MTAKIAPRSFWWTLLTDAMPLMEQKEVGQRSGGTGTDLTVCLQVVASNPPRSLLSVSGKSGREGTLSPGAAPKLGRVKKQVKKLSKCKKDVIHLYISQNPNIQTSILHLHFINIFIAKNVAL